MSEIYPSVREYIRARILQELYRAEEPLSTQQLLGGHADVAVRGAP